MSSYCRLLFCLSALGLLSACGGSSSGPAQLDVTSTQPPPSAITTPFNSNAVKGPLTNARITLTDATGVQLNSFVADTGSTFTLNLSIDTRFPVIVSTTGGVDSFTTQDVSNLDLTLKGVVFSADQITVNINPISTMMVEIALASGQLDEQTMNTVFFNWQTYNFGLPEGFNPVSSLQTPTNTPTVLMAYETFFEVIRRTSNILGQKPNQVILAIAADLTDGLMDGAGTANVDPATTAVFNSVAGVVLIESLTGQLVLDQGGTTETLLTAAAVQTATQTLTGQTNPTAVAALPPSERVIRLTKQALSVAAASATDADATTQINNTITMIDGVTRSETPNATATTVFNNALTNVKTNVNNAATRSVDPTVAAAANQVSAAAFAPTPNNNIPAPNSDFVTIAAGKLVPIAVLANDPEVLDGFAGLTVLQNPSNGSTSINEDNTISYRSSANFVGVDSFTYAVLDSNGDRGVASVTITVTMAPEAVNDSVGTVLNTAVDVQVLANDLKIADTPIVVSVATQPSNGSASVSNNLITYTPATGFSGTDSFTYLITDASGDTSTGTVNVSIADNTEVNPIPIALEDSFSVAVGSTISLNVLANDLQLSETPLTLSASSSNATIEIVDNQLVYTPAGGFGGTDTFEYSVTDASGDSDTAQVTVYVDDTPVAAAASYTTRGQPVTIDLLAGATGLLNPPISALISDAPNSGSIKLTGTTATYTPVPNTRIDDSFTFILMDADDDSSTAIISLPADQLPTITGDPASSVLQGAVYSFTPSASDQDPTKTLSFSIANKPAWATFDTVTGALTGTPTNDDVGLYVNIAITVDNGDQTNKLPNFNIEVINVNDPPTISGTPAVSVLQDAAYTFTATAADIDVNETLTFSASSANGLPAWLQINPQTGVLSGTPTNSDVGIVENVVVSVSDGEATTSLPPFNLEVINVNDPPSISGSPAISILESSAYSFIPTAVDIDANETLSFTLTLDQALPAWLTFDAATGTLSGTPGDTDVGNLTNLTITVSDGDVAASLAPFNLEIINIPPTISGTFTQATEDLAYIFDFTTTGASTFTATGLPNWASISPFTGQITGTPTNDDVGTTNGITVTASDSNASAKVENLSLTVINVNDAPVLTGTPPEFAFVNASYSFQLLANDVDVGDSLTFMANLPSWASLDVSNPAQPVITGTPQLADVAMTAVTVTATDQSSATANLSFTLDVVNGTTIVLTWDNPTTFADGSPLTDAQLFGYEITYTKTGDTPKTDLVNTGAGGSTTWTSPLLDLGVYTFQVRVFDVNNDLSNSSNDFKSILNN